MSLPIGIRIQLIWNVGSMLFARLGYPNKQHSYYIACFLWSQNSLISPTKTNYLRPWFFADTVNISPLWAALKNLWYHPINRRSDSIFLNLKSVTTSVVLLCPLAFGQTLICQKKQLSGISNDSNGHLKRADTGIWERSTKTDNTLCYHLIFTTISGISRFKNDL